MVQTNRRSTEKQKWYRQTVIVQTNRQTKMVQANRHGTDKLTLYRKTKIVQSNRHGTDKQTWNRQTYMTQTNRHGTDKHTWYRQTNQTSLFLVAPVRCPFPCLLHESTVWQDASRRVLCQVLCQSSGEEDMLAVLRR